MAIEVFPVVHVHDEVQATEQSRIAFEAGADGVYLIDHKGFTPERLIHAYNHVVSENPGQFIGLNFLQLSTSEDAFLYTLTAAEQKHIYKIPDGIWVDNVIPSQDRTRLLREQHPRLAAISYLGGVAFKYTDQYTEVPEEAAEQAEAAKPYTDVITTSGEGTGKPPAPAKIRAMKQAIGNQKLAVASGIGIDNIGEYVGNFDQLLVSSSVETEPYSGIFVPEKLGNLIAIAHSM